MKRLSKSYSVMCVLLSAGFASAVATVSTNTVAGFWSDASRWSTGVPTQTDDAVLAASSNAVATIISNLNASARSLVLSNGNSNSSLQFPDGGSLTLYGSEQIAGKGTIKSGSAARSGSLLIAQTNTLLAGSVLNVVSIDVFSLTVSRNSGTAVFTINSNQNFSAVNCLVGNGGTGAGGYLTLAGGQLSLSQYLTLGNDNTDGGTFVLNGGELIARMGIRGGDKTNSAFSLFIFNDGRISSSNMTATNRAFSALSPLNIQLAGTGVHEFNTAAGASVTMEATARLIDKPGEKGTLQKTGVAVLNLNGTNSYSGGTVVSNGTLAVKADGGAGTGDIRVGTAALSLSGGAANDYLNDGAKLILQGTSALYLGFAGTDTVSAVSLDGGSSWLAAGVYDAAALDVMGTGFYSGAGHLNVTNTPGSVAVPSNDAGIWGT